MPHIRKRRFIALLVPCVLSISSSALAVGNSSTAKARAPHTKVHKHAAGRAPNSSRVIDTTPTFDTDSVTASVLLGERAIGSRRDHLNAGQSQAFALHALGAGTATGAEVYVDTRNEARKLLIGLYGDVSGHPGALLSSASLRTPKAGTWNAVALESSQLGAGGTYWLALLGKGVGENWESWRHHLSYLDYVIAAAIVIGAVWWLLRRRSAGDGPQPA